MEGQHVRRLAAAMRALHLDRAEAAIAAEQEQPVGIARQHAAACILVDRHHGLRVQAIGRTPGPGHAAGCVHPNHPARPCRQPVATVTRPGHGDHVIARQDRRCRQRLRPQVVLRQARQAARGGQHQAAIAGIGHVPDRIVGQRIASPRIVLHRRDRAGAQVDAIDAPAPGADEQHVAIAEDRAHPAGIHPRLAFRDRTDPCRSVAQRIQQAQAVFMADPQRTVARQQQRADVEPGKTGPLMRQRSRARDHRAIRGDLHQAAGPQARMQAAVRHRLQRHHAVGGERTIRRRIVAAPPVIDHGAIAIEPEEAATMGPDIQAVSRRG
ncbi:MAG TPA: hypothetical protein PLI83_03390 [Thermomonas sp.]|nr:hypothetical protein [Thermomonas sp.]